MLNSREKKIMFINSMISVAIALAICIPWGLNGVPRVEIILKVIVLPIIALVLFLLNLSTKYRNYRPSLRYTTVACYMPIFTAMAALLFNGLMMLVRSADPYTTTHWIVNVMVCSLLFVSIAVVSHQFYKFVVTFSKNEMMLIDTAIAVLFVGLLFYMNNIGNKYVDLAANNNATFNSSVFFLIVPIVFGALITGLHVLSMVKLYKLNPEYSVDSRERLIKEFIAAHKREYDKAEQHILEQLFTYTRDQLGLCGLENDELETLRHEIEVIEGMKTALEAEIAELKKSIA